MTSRLTYRSPDPEVLAGYAREHRVDAAEPIQAKASITVDASVETVWTVLTDVANWADSLEPGVSNIDLSHGVTVGAPFHRSASGFRMHARFEVVEPQRELAWTGVALGVRVVHRFELESQGPRTLVRCEESMGGAPLAILYSSAKLQSATEASLQSFKQACER